MRPVSLAAALLLAACATPPRAVDLSPPGRDPLAEIRLLNACEPDAIAHAASLARWLTELGYRAISRDICPQDPEPAAPGHGRGHIVLWEPPASLAEAVAASGAWVSVTVILPRCAPSGGWTSPAPVMVHIAEGDAACEAWARASLGPGTLAIVRHPGAVPGFDATGAPAYQPANAAALWHELKTFIAAAQPSR